MLWMDAEEEFALQEEEVDGVMWMDLEQCIEGVKNNSFSNCIDLNELMMVREAAL